MPTSRRTTRAEAEASDGASASPITAVVNAVSATEDAIVAPVTRAELPRSSKLPTVVQFPLAVTLSFAIASVGYNLLGEVTKGDLAAVSRSQDTWVEVGVLAGWRFFELALGWFGNLDSVDIAALGVLSHGPPLYLLAAFYNLKPATGVSALLIDILSAAVPFLLLRPLSAVHKSSAKLPNRDLLDLVTQLYTTGLASAISSVIVVLSFRFVLPRVLVLYFAGVPSLEPAYSASYATILPVTLVFGAAASNFIFAPFATTGQAKEDAAIGEFDPAAATLGETVQWNLFGYTAKTKVGVRRTAIAALVTAVNTYLALTMTIYGVHATGAASYAAVWVSAIVFSGLGLGLVGGE